MREIKFRAWNSKTKAMVDGFWREYAAVTFDGEALTTSLSSHDNEEMYQPDWVLMQYTGLKDKNGKEIYEGDIVKAVEEDGGALIFHDSAPVVWNETEAAFVIEGLPLGRWDYLRKVEVIGNIYENKELLG